MSARPRFIPKAPPRVVIPPAVEAMLRRGIPALAIHRETGVPRTTITRYRDRLGLPAAERARRRIPSLREAFEARTRPEDDGHLMWTGAVGDRGVPILSNNGRNYTAYRVAFWLHHGRWPNGQAQPGCGRWRCVAPAHVEDAETRLRVRSVYASMTGRWTKAERCKRGHLVAEHAKYKPDGSRYCGACQALRRKAPP